MYVTLFHLLHYFTSLLHVVSAKLSCEWPRKAQREKKFFMRTNEQQKKRRKNGYNATMSFCVEFTVCGGDGDCIAPTTSWHSTNWNALLHFLQSSVAIEDATWSQRKVKCVATLLQLLALSIATREEGTVCSCRAVVGKFIQHTNDYIIELNLARVFSPLDLQWAIVV